MERRELKAVVSWSASCPLRDPGCEFPRTPAFIHEVERNRYQVNVSTVMTTSANKIAGQYTILAQKLL